MILIVFMLFFLGCIAIVLEVILPFAISATVGLLLIGLSCYVAFRETSFMTGLLYTFMALVTSLILTRTTVRTSIRWLNLKPPKKATEPISPKGQDRPRLGDLARVVQPLRPTGSVEWEGQRLSARSMHPEREVPVGTTVRIEGQDSIFLLVQEAEQETEAPIPNPSTLI
jgi:membrane-bound ClpP family serine protease